MKEDPLEIVRTLGGVCCGGEDAQALPPGAKVLSSNLDPIQLMALRFTCRLQEEPGMVNMNNCHSVAIQGILDEQRLRQAVDALQARHPLMRAKFWGSVKSGFYLLETTEKIPIYTREGTYSSINKDLERELDNKIEPRKGPFCFVSYIKHPGGTGLLVWGNCHISDGRGCEIMLSQLLKLYDGQDVPFFSNVNDLNTHKRNTPRYKRAGTFVPEEILQTWRSIQADYKELQKRGDRKDGIVNDTFTFPPFEGYKPFCEGSCIEIARLTKEEAEELRVYCRMANTTVTGAIVSAFKYAASLELAARKRGAEQIIVGLDMNQRGRGPIGTKMTQEMGNFVYAVHLYLPVEMDFWESARQMKGLVSEVVKENIGFEAGTVDWIMPMDKDTVILFSQMGLPGILATMGSSETGNISSLGVLDNYGKYATFQVLENHTVSNIGPLGVKLNVCTSGSSGVMSLCAITSNNLVQNPRELAKSIVEKVHSILRNPPPVDENGMASAAEELTRGAELMQPLIEKNRKLVQDMKHAGAVGGDGSVFLGDCSGAYNCTTHLQLAVCVILSCLAIGPLPCMPLVMTNLADAGVMNYMCEEGEVKCSASKELISTAYTLNLFLALFFGLFSGYAFDIFGGRKVACFGAGLSGLFMTLVGLAIRLDARSWPVTQTIAFFGLLAVADIGGVMSSMGLLGWMWHYPKVQALIIGVGQATYQAAGMLGALMKFLIRKGYSIGDGFMLVGVLACFAAFGFWFTVPTQKDYFKQAGRVQNMLAASMDNSSQAGWTHFRHQCYEVKRVMRLFKVQNGILMASAGMVFTSCIMWNSGFEAEYTLMFGHHEGNFLVDFYTAANGLVGVVLNPITGLLIERFGYKCVFVMSAAFVWGLMISSWIWTLDGQTIFTACCVGWLGTYQTVLVKWPVLFAPPHVFGTFQGILMVTMSVIALPLVGLSTALTPESKDFIALPIALASTAGGILTAVCVWVLFSKSYGIPAKPPKNRYG